MNSILTLGNAKKWIVRLIILIISFAIIRSDYLHSRRKSVIFSIDESEYYFRVLVKGGECYLGISKSIDDLADDYFYWHSKINCIHLIWSTDTETGLYWDSHSPDDFIVMGSCFIRNVNINIEDCNSLEVNRLKCFVAKNSPYKGFTIDWSPTKVVLTSRGRNIHEIEGSAYELNNNCNVNRN